MCFFFLLALQKLLSWGLRLGGEKNHTGTKARLTFLP